MRVRVMAICLYGLGILTAVASMGGVAMAQLAVPEIDGGSVAAGLGLLAAGILILKARKVR